MHNEKGVASAEQSDSSGIWELPKSEVEERHIGDPSSSIEHDAGLERAARRKVDLSVLLILFLGLLVFQLDRMNLASALTGGFAKDISIDQSTINLGNQLMFMGIVVFEIPCNMVLQRLGPRKWIAGQVFAFGLTATMQIFVKNRAGFLAARLLLGFSEAGYIPGSIYTLSTWYTPSERAKKVAIFFFGMFGGNAVSPLLASGILRMDGLRGLRGWQWLFLLEGLFTILVACIFVLCLPHSVSRPSPLVGPGTLRLSDREKELLHERLAAEKGSEQDDEKSIDWKLVWSVISHYRRWPTLISSFCVFSTWSPLTTYTPSIIMALGFERTEANALAAVGAFLALVVVFFFAYVSDKTNLRGATVISAQVCFLICVVVARQAHPFVGRWSRWGLWTAVNAFAVGYHPVSNTWLQLNCRDRRERSIGIA
ncbi:Major facilitator superfamily transporter [Cordyceps fumosorosea ARSEF 2679]|uniref:Major facilitator superfamily transporter n=1 Tax=Cordyceps fumosorosea (strain ARSEF 2679) TaxID=1081104 RepID=A0A162JHF6_CORFA|nr:Major facilitator superfamily transporter [Cordyceps fumosorosea ARSEF 2679]OAA69022.1 Major facilitator superfamily transporter [Cordyceps fumosorosea ARSEF 2679]